jgi:hypothetical protein
MWRLLWRVVTRRQHALPSVFRAIVFGEHLIRYTFEDVLPRLNEAAVEASKAPEVLPIRRTTTPSRLPEFQHGPILPAERLTAVARRAG